MGWTSTDPEQYPGPDELAEDVYFKTLVWDDETVYWETSNDPAPLWEPGELIYFVNHEKYGRIQNRIELVKADGSSKHICRIVAHVYGDTHGWYQVRDK